MSTVAENQAECGTPASPYVIIDFSEPTRNASLYCIRNTQMRVRGRSLLRARCYASSFFDWEDVLAGAYRRGSFVTLTTGAVKKY